MARELEYSLLHPGENALQFIAIWRREFGGSSWGWCAKIGDVIGDRVIDLVADRADDRYLRRIDRSSYCFLIEAPQVLERTATTTDDEHIGLLLCEIEFLDRSCDL